MRFINSGVALVIAFAVSAVALTTASAEDAPSEGLNRVSLVLSGGGSAAQTAAAADAAAIFVASGGEWVGYVAGAPEFVNERFLEVVPGGELTPGTPLLLVLPVRSLEEKIVNAMSAGPAPIAQDAAILDYPADWPGNWPTGPAPALIELRAGTNGWTCLVDIPDTPGNDPMCLNETYLAVLQARYDLVDSPSSGVGFGYMLEGGAPIGSPPHMMVFAPASNASLGAFTTEPGPFPWVMFPETSHQHLMVLTPPPPAAVSAADEKIANAMSAGPTPIAQGAAILDYPTDWPGNWPDGPAPELIELRAGTNGWTCLVDIPDTPGNDPMCLNETYLAVLMARYNLVESPSSGVGFGYMLQGGAPAGSPPHMMVFVPESNGSFDAFTTEPGPFPWVMFPGTSHQHLMVLTP